MMANSWRAARCSSRVLGKSITNGDEADDENDDEEEDTELPLKLPLPLPLVLLSADEEEADADEVPLPPISSRAHSGAPWRCVRIHSRKSRAAGFERATIDSVNI
jgi:hypothetical protein